MTGISIIVPVRNMLPAQYGDFCACYRELLSALDTVEILIPDTSCERAFAELQALLPAEVIHFQPEAGFRGGTNDKMNSIAAALARATHDAVFIVDDDARPSPAAVVAIATALESNGFARLMPYYPSPAAADRIDMAGVFVVNALTADRQFWGNVAFRRDRLRVSVPRDALFDEYAFYQAFVNAGEKDAYLHEVALPMAAVRDLSRFIGQRVRYAYENFAYPLRSALFLLILPVLLFVLRIGGMRAAAAVVIVMTLAVMGVAIAGQLRFDHGRSGRTAWLWAPLWFWWYPVTTWIALALRWSVGIEFGGRRVRRAV